MSGLNVAIVDDDQAYCMLLENIMEPLLDVAQVSTFHDGGSFLAAVHENEFNLVLLDLHMPNVDGHSVLESLREDKETARMPVVVLSSSTVQNDVEDAYARGARGYLVKPADIEELEDLLEDLVTMWSRMALPSPTVKA